MNLDFFLKLKHWQLFMLMIIVPLVVMIAGDPSSLIVRLIYGVIVAGSYFGWLYSLGSALNNKLPRGVEMNPFYFKLSFLILALFFVGAVAFELFFGKPEHSKVFILLPLIIFLWIWVLYIFYFVSRSLKMAELQRAVTYYEYIDTFFLLWFYPIGIWSVQPRINQLFKSDSGKTIS